MSVSYFSNYRDPVTGAAIGDDILHLIGRGYLKNHELWSKIGYNGAMTSTAVIWPLNTDYTFLGTGTTLTVKSTSTNDSATGSGLRTVRLHYLDYNFAEKTTTVTLDGTNPVNTTATDIYRINNFRAATAGATYKATGGIYVITGAGTYGYIAAGNTRGRLPVWTVPANKTLYVYQFAITSITSAANKFAQFTLRANYDEKLGTRLSPGFYMPFIELALESDHIDYDCCFGVKLPEKVDLLVYGSANASSFVTCSLCGYVEG